MKTFKKTVIATVVASIIATSAFASEIREGTSGNVSKIVNGKEVVLAETFGKGEVSKTNIPDELVGLYSTSYSRFNVNVEELHKVPVGKNFTFAVNGNLVDAKHLSSIDHDNGDSTWIGMVDDDHSAIITTGKDGVVIGSIETADGEFAIEPHDGGSWVVDVKHSGREVQTFNEADVIEEHDHVSLNKMTAVYKKQVAEDFITANADMTTGGTTTTVTSTTGVATSTVDLFVYYSSLLTNAQTRINYLVSKANLAHSSTGTGVVIRVVGMKSVVDKNPLSNTSALNSLTNAFSEFVDAKTVRTSNGADAVMFVHPFKANQGSCGVGYLNGAAGTALTASRMFSVVSDGVDGIYYCNEYTLAHELAHNMGMSHNRENANGYGAYVDSFGYKVANVFGDIMSYERNVVGKFSSPKFTYNNYPMGIEGKADTARGLKLTAPIVSKFMPTVK